MTRSSSQRSPTSGAGAALAVILALPRARRERAAVGRLLRAVAKDAGSQTRVRCRRITSSTSSGFAMKTSGNSVGVSRLIRFVRRCSPTYRQILHDGSRASSETPMTTIDLPGYPTIRLPALSIADVAAASVLGRSVDIGIEQGRAVQALRRAIGGGKPDMIARAEHRVAIVLAAGEVLL